MDDSSIGSIHRKMMSLISDAETWPKAAPQSRQVKAPTERRRLKASLHLSLSMFFVFLLGIILDFIL